MTRWARSGNTQKHKKMPGDATPWEEFSTAERIKASSRDRNVNQILKGRIDKKKHNLNRKFDLGDSKKYAKQFDCSSSKVNEVKDLLSNEASKSKFSKKKKLLKSSENKDFDDVVNCTSPVDEWVSIHNDQQDESRKVSRNVEQKMDISASLSTENNSNFTSKVLTKRQLKKAKNKMKLIALDVMKSSMPNSEVVKSQDEDFSADDALSDIIPKDESSNMGQSCVAEKKVLDIKSNISPNKKVLTKLQLKKAKKKMKLITLEVLRSGRYDHEDANNQDSENVTESHNSLPSMCLEKKKSTTNKSFKRISENTDDEINVEIVGQEDQVQKKSPDNSLEVPNNALPKNETSQFDATTEVKRLTKNQWRKARIKKKFELLKAMKASEGNEIKSDNQNDTKPTISRSEKNPVDKKNLSVEKLEKERQHSQRIRLPSHIENKIYDLKKTLKEKGLSAKKVRDIVQKERKHEKLKFKRTFGKKPCFNCRKFGHFLSDCPLPLGESTQVTGVCFKCGSTEHTSYKCSKKVEGYPLAKCFICKEQGHISKDCPKNEHGVYINGGKCTLCGNVNHLSKDCPSNKKEKDNVVTVDTINEGVSVDAEMVEPVSIPKNNSHKKKVVKF